MADAALENLKKVKHIVVLMMENRSFDQMLGFLSLNHRVNGVNGLRGDEVNYDKEDGEPYPSFAWSLDETSFKLAGDVHGKLLDPCHGPDCVAEQLETVNGVQPGGFVKNFLATRPGPIPREFKRLPMGHYTEEQLPVYDLLARRYCVCDAWHSSIPGDTWPNRLYAMAGEESEPVLHHPGFLQDWLKKLEDVPLVDKLEGLPIYDVRAFTRQLEPHQWRWYSHDPATLRGADGHYRRFPQTDRDNFAYFDRKSISVKTQAAEGLWVELHDGFLDDAANAAGGLRDVSWIDPNFVDVKILDPSSNDDHPPSDVHAGQLLVLEAYEALVNSPSWENTILVLVYDEHGGFFDHVKPPPVPPGDPSKYETLGVRVPALVVGPRVRNFVYKETLEHGTLVSTILHACLADATAAIRSMPPRVQSAPHLGSLLADEPRPEMLGVEALQAEIEEVRGQLDVWRAASRKMRRARGGEPSIVADGGAGRRQSLHHWQQEFMAFAMAMREAGLPPGQT